MISREQVIEWAREAFGAPMRGALWGMNYAVHMPELEKFAALVADAKESQILDLLERLDEQAWDQHNYYQYAINAIREGV